MDLMKVESYGMEELNGNEMVEIQAGFWVAAGVVVAAAAFLYQMYQDSKKDCSCSCTTSGNATCECLAIC